ncbi:hypothetical protein MMC10_006666 [Thelotrema lepadinum]|nr:hypothetical protein [Thelotrema lepadinum]
MSESLAPEAAGQDQARVILGRRPTPYYPPEALRDLYNRLERIEQSFKGNAGTLIQDSTEAGPPIASTFLKEPCLTKNGLSAEIATERALTLEQLCSGSNSAEADFLKSPYSGLRVETLSPLRKSSGDLAARRAGRVFRLVPNSPFSEGDYRTRPAESSEPLVPFPSLPTSEEASINTSSNSTEVGPLNRLYKDGYRSLTSDDDQEIYSLYGSSDRRSSTGQAFEDVEYLPGPITTDNQHFDPALQASFENYQIKYSRHSYEEPISPKGHQQTGPWINTPPAQSKNFEVRLGPRCRLSVGVHRIPRKTTSRLRHYAHKARKSITDHLSVWKSLFTRLIRRISFLNKRRPRRQSLGITPIPTPFDPEIGLPKIPEFHKHLYRLPEKVCLPEELPGHLETSEAAKFHYNLLVDIIRFGERPRNEADYIDYLEWCDYRAEGRREAGSVPEGCGWSVSTEGINEGRDVTADSGSTF